MQNKKAGTIPTVVYVEMVFAIITLVITISLLTLITIVFERRVPH